jgi:hypothetical protein
MDVITRDMTLHDLNIFASADLSKDIPDSKGELPLRIGFLYFVIHTRWR